MDERIIFLGYLDKSQDERVDDKSISFVIPCPIKYFVYSFSLGIIMKNFLIIYWQ
jgi:hypothetical protein